MTSEIGTFEESKGFCRHCGTILPMLGNSGCVTCFLCKSKDETKVFGGMTCQYVVNFQSPSDFLSQEQLSSSSLKTSENNGPIAERKCRKCGNERMSYVALQLRSADEGQTVFYTCTKCSYKETENS